jgi:hypothetical protein
MNSWEEAAKNVPKPQGGGYMRLKQGANKFRILSAPIQGFETWTAENKPLRFKEYPKVAPENMRPDSKLKFFWAFVVYNFETKAIEILELTQSSIIGAIQALVNSEDWGSPTEYTLTVTRIGEKLETEYSTVPSPAKPTPPEVLKAFKEKPINLDALFSGGNPFDAVEGKSSEIEPIEDTGEDFSEESPF